MDDIFRVDFYPYVWLAKTGMLTIEERGIFIQIVSLIYIHGKPIENDHKWISKAANCSPRMARSLIDSLITKEKLSLIDGKLYQNRAEKELNNVRKRSENGAKGGRKSGENRSKYNDDNDLKSTRISTPSEPIPIDKDRGQTTEDDLSDFSILKILSLDGLEDAKIFASAAQQSVEDLAEIYDNAMKKRIMKPPRIPDKAFSAWIQRITTKRKA